MALDKETADKAAELMRTLQKTAGQEFISDADFLDIYQRTKRFAMKHERQKGFVQQMFVAHLRHRTDKGDWTEVPFLLADGMPEDVNEKHNLMLGMGATVVDKFPDYMMMAVAHIGEGWAAEYTPSLIDDRLSRSLPAGLQYPSKRQDRVEMLVIDVITMDQRHHSTMIEIQRKPDESFKGWGKEIEKLYDPESDEDVRDRVDFNTIVMFQGYFMASKQRRES
jgi:hypothetical protein